MYIAKKFRHIVNLQKEKNIIITHGTDTMAETAKYLSRKIKGKTIVLTGAMVPYKFGSSDGLFNLGSHLPLYRPFRRAYM